MQGQTLAMTVQEFYQKNTYRYVSGGLNSLVLVVDPPSTSAKRTSTKQATQTGRELLFPAKKTYIAALTIVDFPELKRCRWIFLVS
jgi:hypothetical protein